LVRRAAVFTVTTAAVEVTDPALLLTTTV